ncbi:MAG: hypothetical protein N2749_01015 [Clostridia bacterium]|nr:hypothetical protein [Clostridia bacterium]
MTTNDFVKESIIKEKRGRTRELLVEHAYHYLNAAGFNYSMSDIKKLSDEKIISMILFDDGGEI